MGKLIVIEGSCDGVGKSTQYKLLIDRLMKESDKTIVTHHFPSYGTYQARAVEEYLKGNYGKISELSPYFVNSLYAQDRAITYLTGLKEEYDKGNVIVLDRYTTSSLIYQPIAIDDPNEMEEIINYIYDFEYHKLGLPEPDLVIFLYAPFDIIKKLKDKRKNNDGIKDDIYERDMEFMKKVSDVSISLAKRFKWIFIDCIDGDKMRSADEIHEDIYKIVRQNID